MPINVAIVEDDPTTLEVLEYFLGQDSRMKVVGTFNNGETALAALPGINADIVLMDIGLPGVSGIECIKQLKACNICKVLIITGLAHEQYLSEAMKNGADGFLVKPIFAHEALSAIEYLLSGGTPIDGKMIRSLTIPDQENGDTGDFLAELSQREKDIMEYVVKGKGNKEIATLIDLKVATVESYLKVIYSKLQAKNRADAVNRWLRIKSGHN